MGREARCGCRWNGGEGEVKVLLESNELVVRGALRRTVPRSEFREVGLVRGGLRLGSGREALTLLLGDQTARRWLEAMKKPPPSLARKFGLGVGTRVHLVGEVDDPALAEALADTVKSPPAKAELVLVRADREQALAAAIRVHGRVPDGATPLWVVYRKGSESPLGETAVRRTMLAEGFVDTKVASVSERLTATRFSRRRPG